MSLINQMLRDLQQQKKADGQTKPEALRPKMVERIPYLPLPVVLGGAALLLLCLVWWLAGVLSDMMFGFEPVAKPTDTQQIVVNEYSPEAEKTLLIATETDQLTMAEREAEPPIVSAKTVSAKTFSTPAVSIPMTPAVSEPVAAKVSFSAKVAPAQLTPARKEPVVKPVVSKSATAKQTSSPTISRGKKVVAAPRTTKTPRPVKRRSAQMPTKPVAKAPKRLHPDDLPGAILSSSPTLIEPESIVVRPSKSQATTPYGKAEEAYLDGKWALAQERSRLAVRSLQHALELYPGHLPARELLVEVLSKQGKAGEAIFLLAEGLEIAPDYITFKKKYARLLVEQSDYDAATTVMLNGGLPTVEADPEAHVILASLYQSLGEPFLAAQTYRNLLVAWPQTGAFWVGLGGALEGQHLPEEALVCYRRALKTKKLRLDLSQYAKKRLSVLN
ncbi:MAG: tetratricopeptide repeat protein [Desulfuromonadales bacterium]|nr:tetratricopeptide repeat protein [Desulfuromonadales bacterium]